MSQKTDTDYRDAVNKAAREYNKLILFTAVIGSVDGFVKPIDRGDLKMLEAAGRMIRADIGISDREICRQLGVNRNWLYNIGKDYPEFADLLRDYRNIRHPEQAHKYIAEKLGIDTN